MRIYTKKQNTNQSGRVVGMVEDDVAAAIDTAREKADLHDDHDDLLELEEDTGIHFGDCNEYQDHVPHVITWFQEELREIAKDSIHDSNTMFRQRRAENILKHLGASLDDGEYVALRSYPLPKFVSDHLKAVFKRATTCMGDANPGNLEAFQSICRPAEIAALIHQASENNDPDRTEPFRASQ